MRVLLKITDIIDVEVLQRIQDSFSDATGLAAVTVDYKGNPITEYSNFSEYCNCVRKDSNNRDCCYQSDAHGGIESATIRETIDLHLSWGIGRSCCSNYGKR